MEDNDMSPPASNHSPSVQVPNLEVAPKQQHKSESEDQVLGEGNVSSKISIESLITFNPIGVHECFKNPV